MIFSWQRLVQTVKEAPRIIRIYFPLLLVLQGINFFFNQSLSYLQIIRMSSKEDGYIPILIFIAFFGFVAQAIIKVVWVLVICHFFETKDKLSGYLGEHLQQSLIESLRAFFKAIKYAFLLIIPGLVKMVRYHFVVFVVGLEKKYQLGDLDALKASEQLTSGYFFRILFLILFFAALFLPVSTNPFLLHAPIQVFFNELFSFIVITLESIYLYLLYIDLKKKHRDKYDWIV